MRQRYQATSLWSEKTELIMKLLNLDYHHVIKFVWGILGLPLCRALTSILIINFYFVASSNTLITARAVSSMSSSDNVGCTKNISEVSPRLLATGNESAGPNPIF